MSLQGKIRLQYESEKAVPWRTSPAVWGNLKPAARRMRRDSTASEDKLWQHIRNRQLSGYRFRRQHTIGQFIVDFYCAEANLVIEVDGSVHDNNVEQDAIRQRLIEDQGFSVVRFTNGEVDSSIEKVLDKIRSELKKPLLLD